MKVFIAVSEDKLRWPKNCLGKRNNPATKGRTSRQKEKDSRQKEKAHGKKKKPNG